MNEIKAQTSHDDTTSRQCKGHEMKVLVKGQCECVFHEGKALVCPMGNAMDEYNECNIYGISKTHNTTLSLTGLFVSSSGT